MNMTRENITEIALNIGRAIVGGGVAFLCWISQAWIAKMDHKIETVETSVQSLLPRTVTLEAQSTERWSETNRRLEHIEKKLDDALARNAHSR